MATAPTLTLTLTQLKALNPCAGRLQVIAPLFNGRSMTAQQAVKRGVTLGDLIWVTAEIAETDRDIGRRLLMCRADWAANVLHIYERKKTATTAPRNAIMATRALANRQIDAAAWATARAAAGDSTGGAAGGSSRDVAWAVAWSAAWDVAWSAAWGSEKDWQLKRLVEWLSAREPEPLPLPPLPEHLKQAA